MSYSLQELLCEEAVVEIKPFSEIIENETEYDPITEVRRWLNQLPARVAHTPTLQAEAMTRTRMMKVAPINLIENSQR